MTRGSVRIPERLSLTLRPGETLRLDCVVRRRGDLEIVAQGAGGDPRVELELSVVDAATGKDVRPWVAARLVRASDAPLATDPQGRLFLEGLPEGTFTIRGGGAETTAVVLADSMASAVLTLP